MSLESIPVIDIDGVNDNAPQIKLSHTAMSIADACKNIGFFYVKNHGIPMNIIDKLFVQVKLFFDQPLDKKMQISIKNSKCYRGYTPIFEEIAYTSKTRNWCEFIEFGPDLPDSDPRVMNNLPLHGKNQYPIEVPEFQSLIEIYSEHVLKLGHCLIKLLALGLGLDAKYFSPYFSDPLWLMRVMHYPYKNDKFVIDKLKNISKNNSSYKPDNGSSCGAHTDYGAMTLLLADKPGLQAQNRDGEWIDVGPLEGAFLCNLGDTLQYWTNDIYRATPHRVITDQKRYSLPFFFNPNFDTMVVPVDTLDNDNIHNNKIPFQFGPYNYKKYQNVFL